MNIVGAYSPFVEETVVLNGKLNPANTNWMKIQVSHFQLKGLRSVPGILAKNVIDRGILLKSTKLGLVGVMLIPYLVEWAIPY